MEKMIYLDNAATTRMNERVLNAMLPYFTKYYGNPAGIYELGGKSRKAVEHARGQIAECLNCDKECIYFTAGGSESDNWVLQALARKYPKGHMITSQIEHHAMLNTCQYLERQGIQITYLGVDETGMISLDKLERAIRSNTCLISVMTANNEIGTIEPIEKIGAIAAKHGILFHTDAVQAFGHLVLEPEKWKIDFLSASSHKFCGPKGCGFLYMKKGRELEPLLYGGGQERKKRAGTLNVPGIVGMGEAAAWAAETLNEREIREREMRDYLMQEMMEKIPYCRINGHLTNRLSNNVNVSFQFIEGETLLILLDMNGICASAASACSAGSPRPSHVLTAIGLPEEIARASVRFTLGAETSREDIERTIQIVVENVERLRGMSEQYQTFVQRRFL